MKGDWDVRLTGEERAGEDGPGEFELGKRGCGLIELGGFGDFDFESPDLVRERF